MSNYISNYISNDISNNISNNTYLTELKNNIEKLDKRYQIEIGDYLSKIKTIKLNVNENGIFVNLGLLSNIEINELSNKVESFKTIENMLNTKIVIPIANNDS
jgi:hypothetical protein